MHIALRGFVFIQAVQPLCVGKRRQCGNRTDLRLSAGKHRRTMNTRNQINLCCKRADLRNLPAVRTLMILQNHLPHRLFLILINSLIYQSQPFFILCKRLCQLVLDLADIFLSYLLDVCKHGFFHLLRRH